MVANVEIMFYIREKPWHVLGIIVQKAPTSKDALILAGLDWQVIQKPIVTDDGIPILGFKTNLRETDNQGMMITKISKDCLKHWGMKEEELWRLANENTPKTASGENGAFG